MGTIYVIVMVNDSGIIQKKGFPFFSDLRKLISLLLFPYSYSENLIASNIVLK